MKLNGTPLCFIVTYMTGKNEGKKGKSIFSDNISQFCDISFREEKKTQLVFSAAALFMYVLC